MDAHFPAARAVLLFHSVDANHRADCQRRVSGPRDDGLGIEAVVVFLFALVVRERSFRLTGLGLLLLCVGKILVLDVWLQNKSDRFVTFIIRAISLLLVSFLYTRYSEAIKRYL